MNLTVLYNVVKTLLGKDTDPTELNKKWIFRRRVLGSIFAVLGACGYGYFGLILGSDGMDILSDNLSVIYSSVISIIRHDSMASVLNSLGTILTALSVIWGAYIKIKGQAEHTQKLTNAVAVAPAPLVGGKRANDPPATADPSGTGIQNEG